MLKISLIISGILSMGLLPVFAETGVAADTQGKTVQAASIIPSHIPMPVVVPKFEEYESKLLIIGKWGDKPGEYQYRMWEGEFEWPRQFIVTDEEHVYILDQLNNRVQHYNEEGKLLEVIPIESYKLANKEETEGNHGMPFSTVSVDRFKYIDGQIYALTHKRLGKVWGEHVFKLNSGHFEEMSGAEELMRVTQEIPGTKDGDALKKIFAGKRRFQVMARKGEFGPYETFAYDGMNIDMMTQDGHGNMWLMGGRDVKKYSPDGRLLFKISCDTESVAISKAGNVYLLGLYLSGQGSGRVMNVDEYDGVSVRKLFRKN